MTHGDAVCKGLGVVPGLQEMLPGRHLLFLFSIATGTDTPARKPRFGEVT